MEIIDLPSPTPEPGTVLVKTHYSAISTGTEGKTVSDARKGYLAKAKARKEEVHKVIKSAQTIGLAETYKMVQNKLESLQPLGYSLSGEVIAVGRGVQKFKKGDLVACGGSTASHGELAVVPQNLTVKLKSETPLDQAAYTTVGSIAMQGIRRADLKLGETALIIGLGLIGQLTLRLLKSAGVKAFGVDLKPDLVEFSNSNGFEASLREDEFLEERINEFSNGQGVDSVIITAGTSSLDPVEFAGKVCRNRGKVVIVGAVPTGFSRKNYYRKELSLLMSTSYGPGRYDANYEDKGIDYPIGYVRWTENRNMQAFADLLATNSLDIENLITHRFSFDEARSAYDLIVDQEKSKMGVLLEYDLNKEHKTELEPKSTVKSTSVSFIGAGSFAGNFLLPSLKGQLNLEGVMTSRSHTAENAKRKFGFKNIYSSSDQFFASDQAGAVVIASRHDSHAPLAMRSLKAGKRVFLEKPLCLTMDQYMELKLELSKSESPDLMVGFNRRFAPLVKELKNKLSPKLPMAINYRVNAGRLPRDHWVNDPDIGGGRIIGEVCHFIDLCTFLSDSPVESVSAFKMHNAEGDMNTLVVNMHHRSGSVASISYFSNGSKEMAKEHLEVFSGGVSAVINDFKELTLHGKKVSRSKLKKQDKGHNAEMTSFSESIKAGKAFEISTEESLNASLASFAIEESIRQGGELINLIAFESEWISPKAN